jgi:peptidoglycan/xylan/chitin deacetylase (PgdA/CDA1 family)
MPLTLMLIWDYDTPTGFAVSYHSRTADPMLEYTCTDRILALLARRNIVSTFACVGKAAEPGDLPLHNPAQIRQIHAAGHEIASHSHGHELLPTLSQAELRQTLRDSKAALEDCLGAPVVGFVPPWNRPFHHPRRLAFSGKDWRAGGGRWRLSVSSLCAALAETGYHWVRVHYRPVWQQLARALGRRALGRRDLRPLALGEYHGVYTLRLSYCGYDQTLTDWLATLADPGRETTIILYSHPHAIEHDNSQHWHHLTRFAQWYSDQRDALQINFTTPSAWLSAHQQP